MSLDKLNTKEFSLGVSLLPKVKSVAKKVNEIIDYLSGVSGSGSYKKYVAIITQTGTSAPGAEVKTNNLGYNITFTYNGVGSYYINEEAVNDLWISVTKMPAYENDYDLLFTKGDIGIGFVINTTQGVLVNNCLYISVEFRKYN